MPFLTSPLTTEGPLVRLAVAMSNPRVDALKAAGLLYPQPVWVWGLIDTGAGCSAIDDTIVRTLGLMPTGNIQVLSVSSTNTYQTCDQYDVCIAFAKPKVTVMQVNMPVIEARFPGKQYSALIGRDILKDCLFYYNGVDETFTLSF